MSNSEPSKVNFTSAWRALKLVLAGKKVVGFSSSDLRLFLRLSLDNNIGALAFFSLNGQAGISAEMADKLREQFKEESGYNLLAEQVFNDILTLLDTEEILCMPIKGAVFRHFLYPDPATRPSIDLDLCLQTKDFEHGNGVLTNASFVRVDDTHERPVTARDVYERVYTPPLGAYRGSLVEIHRGLIKDHRYPVPYEQIWKRSLTVDEFVKHIGGERPASFPCFRNIRLMTPEDALVHQFLHNANHCLDIPVLSLADARLIIEKWRPDWSEVVKLTRTWGVTAAAYYTLLAVLSAFGTTIPAEVLTEFRPNVARRAWLEQFIVPEGLVAQREDGALQVRFVKRLRNLRAQQVLIGLPLIDGLRQAFDFVGSYVKLRLSDWLEYASSR